jgi:RNA polymerase sigma-70 factor (sigma-E family)
MDDDRGFREFAQTRLARLSRVAFLLTGDHHAAEDLLQSTLERVAQHWDRVVASGSPEGYVRKVLYHEHVSMWRRHRREMSTDSVPERQSGHDEAESALRRLLLERALAKLTHRQRAVVVLRFFEDLSVAEAAEALNCSTGTVKSQTSVALQRLRVLAPELADLITEGVPA